MTIGNRKEGGRVFTILLNVVRKSLTPVRIDWQQFWSEKKPKSVPGFKPGLPRQNAIALPLVPPPLPLQNWCFGSSALSRLVALLMPRWPSRKKWKRKQKEKKFPNQKLATHFLRPFHRKKERKTFCCSCCCRWCCWCWCCRCHCCCCCYYCYCSSLWGKLNFFNVRPETVLKRFSYWPYFSSLQSLFLSLRLYIFLSLSLFLLISFPLFLSFLVFLLSFFFLLCHYLFCLFFISFLFSTLSL